MCLQGSGKYLCKAVRDEYHFSPRIRISNIFEISILHEYEYEYIRDIEFGPNTNMNIYLFIPNIRIFEYFGTNICLNQKELDKNS